MEVFVLIKFSIKRVAWLFKMYFILENIIRLIFNCAVVQNCNSNILWIIPVWVLYVGVCIMF